MITQARCLAELISMSVNRVVRNKMNARNENKTEMGMGMKTTSSQQIGFTQYTVNLGIGLSSVAMGAVA